MLTGRARRNDWVTGSDSAKTPLLRSSSRRGLQSDGKAGWRPLPGVTVEAGGSDTRVSLEGCRTVCRVTLVSLKCH